MKNQETDKDRRELRKRAETRLDNELDGGEDIPVEDTRRLLYELRTHQIELEMQNQELRRFQEESLEARDRYIDLYDFAPVGYLTLSPEGIIIEANLTIAGMLGVERQPLIKRLLSSFIRNEDQDTYYQCIAKLRKTNKKQSCELRMWTKSCNAATKGATGGAVAERKSWFWAQMDGRSIVDDNEVVQQINLSIGDISERKEVEAKLQQLAINDQLTQLPNRYQLETELNKHIKSAKRFKEKLAILFIDLDNFKVINDTMGHEYGDILLQRVAERLSSTRRDYDTVARFGGDEFVLLIPKLSDNSEVVVVAEKIIGAFSVSFHLKEKEIFVTASIGISLFPDDGMTVGALLQNADAAMYRAKERGRNHYLFFTQAMNDELHRQQSITTQLRLSLTHQEFELYYQPQVDSRSGKIVCCEALLRLFPIDGEPIPPSEFIPIAEKSELIHRIGEWVIDAACCQRDEWKKKGLLDFRIDVNLSGKQFLHRNVFLMLKDSLMRYNLTRSDIGIELTENILIQANEENLSNLRSLHDSGMEISIDDFGTGYSSLSYLKSFPVRNLKIDQQFVRDAQQNQDDRSIMETIVAVGHRLGLKVVAEGIETEEQHLLAQEIGCDLEQGYFFYKPMRADEMYSLLT